MSLKKMQYTRVPKTSFDDTDTDTGLWMRWRQQENFSLRIILGALMFTNIGTLCVCGLLYLQIQSDQFYAGVDDEWYPNDYTEVRLEATKYTELPSVVGDSVEDEWIRAGAYPKPIPLPEKWVSDFGFDPNRHHTFTADEELDIPAGVYYMADVAVTHYVHCLNIIRQGLWFNHDYYRDIHSVSYNASESMTIRHVGHCLDVLLELVKCESDLELWPWIEDKNGRVVVDMSASRKKCKNWDSRIRWIQGFQHVHKPIKIDDHHHDSLVEWQGRPDAS